MLYEKIDGELQPITTQPKQVRKLIGNELVDIHRKLIELIQQKDSTETANRSRQMILSVRIKLIGEKMKLCKRSF